MNRIQIMAAVFCCMFILSRCTNDVAGGGTETTNGIYGTVELVNASGPYEQTVIAALYSTTYRPDSGIGRAETTTVDFDGNFRFDSLPEGSYNLFIWDTARSLGASRLMLESDTTLDIISLVNLSTVLPYTFVGAVETRLEVTIPGTPFHVLSTSGESVPISGIPEGTYRILYRVIPVSSGFVPPEFKEKSITIDYSGLADSDTLRIQIP